MFRSAETLRFLRLTRKIAPLLLFCATASLCHAQTDAVVCSKGSGSFEATFHTGVKVEVGAARRDGLATRMCQAALSWDKNDLVVAPSAAEVDIDSLGIDLGLGSPVVTFQVKQNATDCCSTLLVYSLQRPPRLLRTIAGGGSYSSEDRSLNGQVEIWTSDTSSLAGFEPPIFNKSGLAPTVVLRFVHGRLLDAGSEFQSYFDEAVASARHALTADDLRAFKSSDGRLAAAAHFSEEDQRQSETLQRTKIRVLQIVWSYLYSGREEKAWSSLAELWPAADFERIKAEIVRARGRGILTQLDGASTAGHATGNTAHVYDLRTEAPMPQISGTGRKRMPVANAASLPSATPPVPIFIAHLLEQGESEEDLVNSEMLDLTIDCAGKVRAIQSADPAFAARFKDDSAGWKFIPAMDNNRPVASRILLVVSPKR